MYLKKLSSLLLISIITFSVNAQEIRTFFWDDENKIIQSEGIFKEGKEHGIWKFWNKEGKLVRESEFYKGEIKGRVTYFYENGNKMNEGFIFKGIQSGLYKEWYSDGTLNTI